MKAKLVLLIFFTALTSLWVHAKVITPGADDYNSSKTDIAGGVVHAETKKGIGNVVITAYLSSKKEKVVITDGNGNYSFDDLKPGTYKFVFEKDGFKKVTKNNVQIRADEGFQLNVEMNEPANFDILPSPSHLFTFQKK